MDPKPKYNRVFYLKYSVYYNRWSKGNYKYYHEDVSIGCQLEIIIIAFIRCIAKLYKVNIIETVS